MALHLVKRRVCVGDCEKGEVMAAENVPCSGGCGKVRSILHGDSPKQWLCYTCAQKKKPSTDRAALHRALDAVRASCPVCLETVRTYKCGSGMCLTSHDVKGKECAGTNRRVDFATDRASLHRALDAVFDGARAKDGMLGLLTCGWCDKHIRESLARPGKYTHLTEADAVACAHPAMPK